MKKLNKKIEKEIIAYCRGVIKKLNLEYLKTHLVNKNEFLEFLYLTSVEHYKSTGGYELTDEEIALIFSYKKVTEENLKKIREGETTLIGIDKEDNLIIPKEENEISNRRAIEKGND